MKVKEITLSTSDVPKKLRNIPDPPKYLYIQGSDVNELLARPCVAIVGSRKVSAYGRAVTIALAGELARAGVVIISGLALGVDSIAHRAALDAGGLTIAVLPGGLDNIYPGTHRGLARQIVEQGGALVSEHPPGSRIYASSFLARNRLVSGISDAVVVIEAAQRSGTLSTATFALEQGKELLAVPGNITSPTSAGTNNLIKTGASPVTSADDIFHVLGIAPSQTGKRVPSSSDPNEQTLLDLLISGISDGATLLNNSKLEVSTFNQSLTMLEIRGQIRALGNNHWGLQ